MTGGSFTAVAMTVVVLLLLVPLAVSVALMVKVVVTVPPGATWCAVGLNTSASTAVVTGGGIGAGDGVNSGAAVVTARAYSTACRSPRWTV